MTEAFICDAVRTPIGRYGGGLAKLRTDDLAALPIKALMERNPDVAWDQVDEVLMGCANQAGEDNRNVARMAALLAGLPAEVPGATINRLCGSGLDAVGSGARAIKTGEAGGGVWVSLTDTGGGIPQEQIKRIFEPYYTTKEKGSGLGLMIVQRIVRDHDGRLELVSHGGKGTTFRIWLPQEERRQHLLEAATSEA